MEEKREYIFPINYKNKEKFLGLIDYKIIATIAILAFIMFYILKNIEISLTIKVTIFILVIGFFSILLIVGVNGENMLDFLFYIIKFLMKEKVYLYRKEEEVKRCESLLKRISQ